MQTIPDAGSLPLPQAPPAGHATAEAELLRQVFRGDAGHQNEEDAVEGGTVVAPRSAALGRRLGRRQQWLKVLPKLLADQGSFHPLVDIAALRKFLVLLAALNPRKRLPTIREKPNEASIRCSYYLSQA